MADRPKREKFPEASIRKIMALEQFFYGHSMSVETINQLVQTYISAVEYFDSVEPSIRTYFLEKIQFVLSRPEIMNTLSGVTDNKSRETVNNIRDTLRGTYAMNTPNVMVNPVFNMSKKPPKTDFLDYDQDKKKKERSIKAQMYMEVQNEIKDMTPKMREEFFRLEKMQNKKEEDVKNMLEVQNSDLEKRLQQRKMKKKPLVRKSLEKKKIEEEEQIVIKPVELIQIQQEISQNVQRFTIRQQIRQTRQIQYPPISQNQEETSDMKKKKVNIRQQEQQEPMRPTLAAESFKKKRVTIRQDDD